MNETLMIEIKAKVDEALKKIDEVTKGLKETGEQSKKSAKTMSDSMKSATRAAQLQVEAIKQVISSLVNFGKSSIEAQKNISKLNAAFLAAGSTTKQAGETYKNLYRFMGDNAAATEAAQNLARITTNTQDLAEWTKILQGVYARAGDAIPIESLSEAANETIQVAKVTGAMADALNWVGVSEDAFNAKLAKTSSLSEREALVRSTLNGLYMNAANIYERNNKALLANAESQARLDIALAQAGRAILPLMTSVNNLATTLLTVLRPAFEIVASIIAIFVEYIIVAVKWISAFFSIFSGGSKAKDTTKEVANNVGAVSSGAKAATGSVGGLGSALSGAAKAAKELKKQTMGFDELNVVQSDTSSASGGGGSSGGGGGGISIPDMSSLTEGMPDLSEFTANLEGARGKAQAILAIIASIAATVGLWNLSGFITDLVTSIKHLPKVKELVEMTEKAGYDPGILKESQEDMEQIIQKAKLFGGLLLIVAGALLLVQGYCDAWVNGIDWGNFAAMLGGLALIVGGLALAFGPVVAGVGAIAGGIALLVVGIRDFVKNGYSMENVLTILAGVIAVVTGVCLAFNTTLLANPIALTVVAIAALVAAFVILWNECEGFRNFWINLWEKIKSTSKAFADWFVEKICKPAANIYNKWIKPVIDKIVEIIAKTIEIIGAIFVGLWNLLQEKVLTPIGNGFSKLWQTIKDIFSPVTSWFSDVFGKAWTAIKNVFSSWGSFFSGLWDKIKNTFSKLGTSIGDAIGDAVKSGINGVISMIEKTINKAVSLINGAIDLINKLPGVSVSKLTKLSLPRLAKGGIVDSATVAMIGEAGKEAVIPLENNTQWMDKLADRIAAKNNNPTKIILKVGEKELGWATIGAINGITEQTGGLQLAL